MRDWFLPLTPVGAIIYFIMFPDQFNSFLVWAERFVR
jgi:hypothetical protein